MSDFDLEFSNWHTIDLMFSRILFSDVIHHVTLSVWVLHNMTDTLCYCTQLASIYTNFLNSAFYLVEYLSYLGKRKQCIFTEQFWRPKGSLIWCVSCSIPSIWKNKLGLYVYQKAREL